MFNTPVITKRNAKYGSNYCMYTAQNLIVWFIFLAI